MANLRALTIEQELRRQLAATHVEVIDDSARHADHLGAEGDRGHFRVVVVSERFARLSRVEAQRLVYRALGSLMATDIHALEMQTFTPQAWTAARTHE